MNRTTTPRWRERALRCGCLRIVALLLVLAPATLLPVQEETPTIEQLVEELGSGDGKVRREAAYQLSLLGKKATPAVPALVKALGDGEQQVWFLAAVALAKIGPDAKDAVPKLADGLRNRSSQVRYRSAYALGRIGEAAVPALVDALDSSGSSTRALAARAFGWIRPPSKKAKTPLLDALRDEEDDVRRAAAESLATLGALVVEDLGALLDDSSPAVRTEAARALHLTEADLDSQQKRLIDAVSDVEASVRTFVLPALRRCGLPASKSVPLLVDCLGDDDATVRRTAAQTLLKLDPKNTVNALIGVLRSDDQASVFAATRILEKIGSAARAAIPALVDAAARFATDDESPLSSALASFGEEAAKKLLLELDDESLGDDESARVIRVLIVVGAPSVEGLSARLEADAAKVRTRAAAALAGIGRSALPAKDRLLVCTGDEDAMVRANATRAFGEFGKDGQDARPRLLELLEDVDARVRASAIYALGGIGLESASLIPILLGALDDESADIRRSAITALYRAGREAAPAVAKLGQALEDSDVEVRANAAKALAAIGAAARPAIPRLAERVSIDEDRVRLEAIRALGAFGEASKDAVEPLIKILERKDPAEPLLLASIETLGAIGTPAEPAADALRRACKSESPKVRAVAIRAISAVIAVNDEVIPLLVEALKDGSGDVQRAAVESLGEIGGEAQTAVPALFELLDDEYRRKTASEALEKIGPRDIGVLRQALRHREAFVRVLACQWLGELGKTAKDIVPELKRMVSRERDRRVKRSAYRAVKKIEDDE